MPKQGFTPLSKYNVKKILFVGGFFLVAKKLAEKGYDVTVADYSEEMVEEGRVRLPKNKVIYADLRKLPFKMNLMQL